MNSKPISTERLDVDSLPDLSRHAFELSVTSLVGGVPLTLPVNLIAGRGPRPRVALVAGIHGDEHEGILALLDLWRSLSPEEISGRLLIVPVANPPAFGAGTRTSPIDGLDMNRIFPGKPRGTASEQLAHTLFTNVVSGADLLFSLHSWFAVGTVLPYIEIFEQPLPVVRSSYEAALASGFEHIRISDWPPGLLTRCANEVGVVGIEAEVGGYGHATADGQRVYRDALIRVLEHVGALPPIPRRSRVAPHIVRRIAVQSSVGGFLRLRTQLGDSVTAGEVVAEVADCAGRSVAAVTSPEAGIVAAIRGVASVAPGHPVVWLFTPAELPAFGQGQRRG